MTHDFEPKDDMSNVVHELVLDPHNYYGNLTAAKTEDAMGNEYYWWSVENWDGHNWYQIDEALFDTLIDHARDY